MTYKLGDRVVVTKHTRYSDLIVGLVGTVTHISYHELLIGVTFDNKPTQYKAGRIYFTPSELEFDKKYLVQQIINDL